MEKEISKIVVEILKLRLKASVENIEFQATRKEFKGDITIVLFPLLKKIKTTPNQLGELIGSELKSKLDLIEDYNLISGFLNLTISSSFYISFLNRISKISKFGHKKPNEKSDLIMVEYSSPNTNKPLHLGHIRNNLLGFSISKILTANGYNVIKTQIINDRGIHICKSMIAWKIFGKKKTPSSYKIKGDQFVGKYYVLYNQEYESQVQKLIRQGQSKEYAKSNAPIFIEAKKLLKKWESNDKEVWDLWSKMNNWVYDGFDSTYKKLGVDFDSLYYESETYLLGKKIIEEGLRNEVFYSKKDGSVWVDLKSDGLDEKLLLRSDGTSVYMTQDLGTAFKRFLDYPNISGMVYTVGNEQDYHFKVLFKILEKLDYKWAKECYHLSYGMIDLPDGKMKSREGKVVDADDLINHMIDTAKMRTEELGKIEDFNSSDLDDLYKKIAFGALKYYLLRVDPKKKILFNPEESIDFNGNTGPFIQYTYARIKSIVRRAEILGIEYKNVDIEKSIKLSIHHKKLINQIYSFPSIIKLSLKNYSPAYICQFLYELSKLFNSFYQEEKIIDNNINETTSFKIALSDMTSSILKSGLDLLGIDVTEKM